MSVLADNTTMPHDFFEQPHLLRSYFHFQSFEQVIGQTPDLIFNRSTTVFWNKSPVFLNMVRVMDQMIELLGQGNLRLVRSRMKKLSFFSDSALFRSLGYLLQAEGRKSKVKSITDLEKQIDQRTVRFLDSGVFENTTLFPSPEFFIFLALLTHQAAKASHRQDFALGFFSCLMLAVTVDSDYPLQRYVSESKIQSMSRLLGVRIPSPMQWLRDRSEHFVLSREFQKKLVLAAYQNLMGQLDDPHADLDDLIQKIEALKKLYPYLE